MIQPNQDFGFVPETQAPVSTPTVAPQKDTAPVVEDLGFVAEPQAPAAKIDWNKKYAEVDSQESAISKADRLDALNQAWMAERMPGMSQDAIRQNSKALASGFAGLIMGGDTNREYNSEELSGLIKKRISHERLVESMTPKSLFPWAAMDVKKMPSLSETGEQVFRGMTEKSLMDWVPDANAPDIRQLGPLNPAILAAVHNTVIKPLAKGLTTPLGLALAPITAAEAVSTAGFNFTKGVLGGISGGFSVLMAKENAEYFPEFKKVFDDPNTTFQQRTEAVSKLVFNNVLGIATALGAVTEVYPAYESLAGKTKGKTPQETAKVFREEANNVADPVAADALVKASEQFDNPNTPPSLEQINQQFQTLVPAPEPVPFSGDVKLGDLIGQPVEYSGYKGTLIRDEEGNFVLLRDVVQKGESNMIEIADTGKVPDILAAEVGVAPKGGFEKVVPVDRIKAPAILAEDGSVVEGTIGKSHDDIGIQGERVFVTDSGKVVNRTEGAVIAKEAGQVPIDFKEAELHSSNLTEAAPEKAVKPTGAMPIAVEQEGFGISNASIDAQLKDLGLPEATHGERKAWENARENAVNVLRENPYAGKALVEELNKEIRPATANENAILTAEIIRLRNERTELEAVRDQARKAKDELTLSEVQAKIAKVQDDFELASEVVTKAGTANAQALAIRAMMLKEDYSMASLERQFKAARPEKSLTAKDVSEIEGYYQKITETQKRLDAKMAEMMAEFQRAKVRKVVTRPPAEPSRTMTFLSEQATAARQRLKAKGGRVSSGIDPTDFADYAIIGAEYIAKGVRDFSKWSSEMTKEFGDVLKPRLQEIYDRAIKERKDATRLQAYKTRTEKQTTDLLDRARTGQLEPKAKPEPFKFDEEALRLKAENIEAKREFQKALLKKQLEERTTVEYVRDQFLKYRRGFLLSNPVTLAKLTAAAAARIGVTPIEEIVGGVISKLPGVAKVAEKAPREGGFNIQAESKAVAAIFEKGLPDAWETMTKGRGPIDSVFGRKGVHESEINPSAVEFFGNLHSALKSPVKRAEFVRATEKISEFYAKQGIDISDPIMIERIGMEAYKSAERSIFMNDNAFATAFNNAIRSLEAPSKATGKPTLGGKAASTVLQTLFPIVKVPTSIVLETAEYAGGLPLGLYNLKQAYTKGIDNLTPQQADIIMRQLKKGSIGSAMLLLGYFNPDIFGGYYELGEKRKPDEPQAKSMKIDGKDVPAYLLHAPIHEIPQIGATARRTLENKIKKGESEETALASGAWAAGIGLIEEIPFTRGAVEVSRLVDPNRREAAAGNILKSIVVPQLFQYAAEKMDVGVSGEPIKRKPKTMMQAIESGIPGLREDVPVKRDISTSYRK